LSINLIHSCRRVQQLLVREIFLRGMSDGTLPIRDLTFRWANRFADVEQPIQRGRVGRRRQLIYFSYRHLSKILWWKITTTS
jgi:hypothetical protein